MSTQLEKLLRSALESSRPFSASVVAKPELHVRSFLFTLLLPRLVATCLIPEVLKSHTLVDWELANFEGFSAGSIDYYNILVSLRELANANFADKLKIHQDAKKIWSAKLSQLYAEQKKEQPSPKKLLSLEDELIPLEEARSESLLHFLRARNFEEITRLIPSAYGHCDSDGSFTSAISLENTTNVIKWLLRTASWRPAMWRNGDDPNLAGEDDDYWGGFSSFIDSLFSRS